MLARAFAGVLLLGVLLLAGCAQTASTPTGTSTSDAVTSSHSSTASSTRSSTSTPTTGAQQPGLTLAEARALAESDVKALLSEPRLYWVDASEQGDYILHPGGAHVSGERLGDGRANAWHFAYANATRFVLLSEPNDGTLAAAMPFGGPGGLGPLPQALPALADVPLERPASNEGAWRTLWWNPDGLRIDVEAQGAPASFDGDLHTIAAPGADTPTPRLSYLGALEKARAAVPPGAQLIEAQKTRTWLPFTGYTADLATFASTFVFSGIDVVHDGRAANWQFRFQDGSSGLAVLVAGEKPFVGPWSPNGERVAVPGGLLDSTAIEDHGDMRLTASAAGACWAWTSISGDVAMYHYVDARTGAARESC